MIKEIARDHAAPGAWAPRTGPRAPRTGPRAALTLTTPPLKSLPLAPKPGNAATFNNLLIKKEIPGKCRRPPRDQRRASRRSMNPFGMKQTFYLIYVIPGCRLHIGRALSR